MLPGIVPLSLIKFIIMSLQTCGIVPVFPVRILDCADPHQHPTPVNVNLHIMAGIVNIPLVSYLTKTDQSQQLSIWDDRLGVKQSILLERLLTLLKWIEIYLKSCSISWDSYCLANVLWSGHTKNCILSIRLSVIPCLVCHLMFTGITWSLWANRSCLWGCDLVHQLFVHTFTRQLSDSKLYLGVESRPWTFQRDLSLYLLIWNVLHISRSVHQWVVRWGPFINTSHDDPESTAHHS